MKLFIFNGICYDKKKVEIICFYIISTISHKNNLLASRLGPCGNWAGLCEDITEDRIYPLMISKIYSWWWLSSAYDSSSMSLVSVNAIWFNDSPLNNGYPSRSQRPALQKNISCSLMYHFEL